MRRAFTTREKVLLVILAVLLVGIGYFKFLLEPVNDGVTQYQMNAAAEQDEIIQNTAVLRRMRDMQNELDQIHASGDDRPLPAYDNADAMLVELNTTLSRASDYSLNFGTAAALEDAPYIMRRPLTLTFTADSYEQARSILDELHDSDNINQISDLSITFKDDASVSVTMSISFFELMR